MVIDSNQIMDLVEIAVLFIGLLIIFFIWLNSEFNSKLEVEQDLIPSATTIATVQVKPGRTLHDKGMARVTVYKDMIVIMHTRQRRRFAREIRNFKTGNYALRSKLGRFAHIIVPTQNMNSLKVDLNKKQCEIDYKDNDGIVYNLIISDPVLFHNSFMQVLNQINLIKNN
jgi:hypothetical protein